MYPLCMFYAKNFGPPGLAHDSLHSYRGLALREVDRGMRSLRSGYALTASVAASAALVISCP